MRKRVQLQRRRIFISSSSSRRTCLTICWLWRDVGARLLAVELVARAADGEALVVQQAADLADDDHVLALVVAAVAAALHRLELRELLLPIAQHVRLDAAQLADFADGEVALAGDRRQLRRYSLAPT